MSDAVQEAELWIGSPALPIDPSRVHGISMPRISIWEGLSITEFQIAGVLCHHQVFFGFKFKVPETDLLAKLGHTYLGTHLPGNWSPKFSTSQSAIDKARGQLRELGLKLEEPEKDKLAEAYMPIESECAWSYAMNAKLPIFLHPHEHALATVPSVEEIYLDGSWEQASQYLEAAWDKLQTDSDCESYYTKKPQNWTSVLHYLNCD